MKVTSISEEYITNAGSSGLVPELVTRSCFSGFISEIFSRSRKYARTSVMLTSPQPRSGVSFICSSIAIEMALHGAKVLLVDAHALLAVRALSPLSVTNLCRRIGPLQLWVLGREEAAAAKTGAKDTRNSTAGALLHELEQDFPYVLIDAPPLSAAGDANLLATSVYGTVIVARSGQTGEAQLKHAQKALTEFGGRLLGTVFNAH